LFSERHKPYQSSSAKKNAEAQPENKVKNFKNVKLWNGEKGEKVN
jgi:hypothetical protein